MELFRLGYTTGVFDVFHIGHLNLLRNAKSLCQTLVVGVSTDELVAKKGKKAVIPFEQRIEIVRHLVFVDAAIPQVTTDKTAEWQRLKFDAVFVGDDWFADASWVTYEQQLPQVGFIYFPYTDGVSSTSLKAKMRRGD